MTAYNISRQLLKYILQQKNKSIFYRNFALHAAQRLKVQSWMIFEPKFS